MTITYVTHKPAVWSGLSRESFCASGSIRRDGLRTALKDLLLKWLIHGACKLVLTFSCELSQGCWLKHVHLASSGDLSAEASCGFLTCITAEFQKQASPKYQVEAIPFFITQHQKSHSIVTVHPDLKGGYSHKPHSRWEVYQYHIMKRTYEMEFHVEAIFKTIYHRNHLDYCFSRYGLHTVSTKLPDGHV